MPDRRHQSQRRRIPAAPAFPVRAQRRPEPDGARLVRAPRRRPRSSRLVGWLRTRRPGQPGRPSRRWPRSASTSPASFRSRGPTRSSAPPTSSSRWVAATPARTSRASATRTGSSTTRPDWTCEDRSAPSATRSATGSARPARRPRRHAGRPRRAWAGLTRLGATGPVDAAQRRPWIDWIHTAADQGAIVRNYTKWDDQPASPGAARVNPCCGRPG